MEIFCIIILFGIIYLICCILDGPDLKPKWKKYIVEKLCSKSIMPSFQFIQPEIIETKFEPLKIQNYIKISNDKLNYCYSNKIDKNYMINRYIDQCKNNISNDIKKYIDIDLEENYSDTTIIGTLYIHKRPN